MLVFRMIIAIATSQGIPTANLNKKDCEEKRVVVPKQDNDFDCGVFVLFSIGKFLKQAPEVWSKQGQKKDMVIILYVKF
jgi:Ulp1 family protease